jgi:hypothetical protein
MILYVFVLEACNAVCFQHFLILYDLLDALSMSRESGQIQTVLELLFKHSYVFASS